MKRILFIHTLMLLLVAGVTTANAQEKERRFKKKPADEKVVTNKSDSTKSVFAKRDTLKVQAIKSNLYWYDLRNKLQTRKDTSDYLEYRFNDDYTYNFRDASDVLRRNSRWFAFNLHERGRPTYVAAVNHLPHQSAVMFDKVAMNNLTNGLFNLLYIPLSAVRNVESSLGAGSTQQFGRSGTSRLQFAQLHRHSKASWTRILFKQGNQGHTDLDIAFVQPISETFSIQLAGNNALYDGLLSFNSSQHQNYRAEVTWQVNPKLYVRGQLFLNRVRSGLTPLISSEFFGELRDIGLRDDYFLEATWFPGESNASRLHISLFQNYASHRLKRNLSTWRLYSKEKNYGLNADYTQEFFGNELLVGGGATLSDIHGVIYETRHNPVYGQAYGQLTVPFGEQITLIPAAQFSFRNDFNPQLNLSSALEWKPDKFNQLILEAGRATRFPNLNEMFIKADSISGNPRLIPEEELSVEAEYKWRPAETWWLSGSGGYHRINNEITFSGQQFSNSRDRDFTYVGAAGGFDVWRFQVSAGGHLQVADINITPENSAWLRLHFHDIWLSGAVIVDAFATMQYSGVHNQILFDPRVERFYDTAGSADGYSLFNWKIVGKVQDARIFFEMDNQFEERYELVYGFTEYFQRWRFGVDWVLWD